MEKLEKKIKSSFRFHVLRKQVQWIGGGREGVSWFLWLSVFLNTQYITDNYHGALHSVPLANDDDDFVPLHCHLLCNDHRQKNYKKTPDPKCRLYWCLIEFIDWRYSQSCWYFRTALWSIAPLNLLSGKLSPRSPLHCVKSVQCVRREGRGE